MNDAYSDGRHRVFIGFDPREKDAFEVACHSLFHHASAPVFLTALKLRRLAESGILRRPSRICGKCHTMWDEISDAPQSTEFAISRFLTPILAQHGFALFVDCDVVFLGDVAELFAFADPQYAVQVVQHQPIKVGEGETKMDGQPQLAYPRKNWSSVMLFNCDHPANQFLTLKLLNDAPGRDLHRFCWLKDEEVGRLPGEWNWLVGVQPKPARPQIAHFTLGGPWLPDWKGAEHDSLWLDAQAHCRTAGGARVACGGQTSVPH
jgi:hypothetical protein